MATRRQFIALAATAGGGLAIGLTVEPLLNLKRRFSPATLFGEFGWIEVSEQYGIEVKSTLTEMGQGAWTTLAQIVAEELEVDFDAVTVRMAATCRAFNAPIGFFTGGSSSTSRLFQHMRNLAAAARHQFIAAAADAWSVHPGECTTTQGAVIHAGTNRRAQYGELAHAAVKQPLPPAIKPKAKSEWRVMGHPVGTYGAKEIVTGQMQYGIDLVLPNMLVAAVAQRPTPGATLQSLDRAAAQNASGVVRVVELSDTIAVVARTYWQAHSALLKARVKWEATAFDNQLLRARLMAALDGMGTNDDSARSQLPDGSPDTSVELIATYETPLLSHAQLEPLNATAKVDTLSAELWVPTQAQQLMQGDVAQALGIWAHGVTIHTPRLGGGFGRRLATDYGVTAALLAREFTVPIKVIWSREEDFRQGRFRPMGIAKLKTRLNEQGDIVDWNAQVASLGQQDRTSGLQKLPYATGRTTATYAGLDTEVRTGSWRSVDASQNVFYRESFIDECALAANFDPISYRKHLLKGNSRALRVIDALAKMCGWQATKTDTRALGVAFNNDFGSLASAAADLLIGPEKQWRVARLYVVVDCGIALNPNLIKAQIEGGALFGLSAAIHESTTIANSQIDSANYDTYRILRFDEAPEVVVEILESEDAEIGGIGEVAVPLIAPAVANAIFAGTAIRNRRLPLLTPNR